VIRPAPLASRLLVSVATLVLLLGALELVLRATGTAPLPVGSPLGLPGLVAGGESFSRPDDLLIYAIAPRARTYPWYAIDAHGFRTPDFEERKPPGTLRLVVTGDSTTFGLGVLEEQRWSSVLRGALAGLCAGVVKVEVINAGVPGYSLVQNRLQVERDLLPLQPDLLAVLVTAGNDGTRVEGPGDREIVAAQSTLAARLSGLALARALGGKAPARGAPPPKARAGSPTARPRVSADEAAEELAALADSLPGRVVLGVFQSQTQRRQSPEVDAIAERVTALAAARGLPLADARGPIEALLPYPLYLDGIHPTPLGHVAIARTMLAAVLPALSLPEPRAGWAAAFLAASEGDVATRAGELRGDGAPPGFTELLALCDDAAALNARLARDDDTLPAALRDWDPLGGRLARARSSARLLLASRDSALPRAAAPDGAALEGAAGDGDGTGADPAARLAELAAHVRPGDALVACFGGEAGLLAADARLLAVARAVVAFGAQLGLPPARVDARRGEAELAPQPEPAVELLQAVLALDPGDVEARYDLGMALRRAGRREASREEFVRLAALDGPHALFARGLLAWERRELAGAEAALREAIALAPALGYAHVLLGQVLLASDRLDEAARELVLASVLLGSVNEMPALLRQIADRRAELAAGSAGSATAAPPAR
jgi:lysophospholipase L1-like esterase/tetratricopeptide (TPR) repeat protein